MYCAQDVHVDQGEVEEGGREGGREGGVEGGGRCEEFGWAGRRAGG